MEWAETRRKAPLRPLFMVERLIHHATLISSWGLFWAALSNRTLKQGKSQKLSTIIKEKMIKKLVVWKPRKRKGWLWMPSGVSRHPRCQTPGRTSLQAACSSTRYLIPSAWRLNTAAPPWTQVKSSSMGNSLDSCLRSKCYRRSLRQHLPNRI